MSEASKKKFTVRKKKVSEKQRLANIRNSRLSRGPVTLAGNNVCKYANLQHGLRAATVLPGEEQTYTERFSKWTEELGADASSLGFMVHRAVMSSLRLDRGDVADVAMIGEHRDAVVNEAELRAGDDLDRLVAQLAGAPAATMRRLRMTPTGCAWIHSQLLMLKIRLRSHRSLLDSQRRLLCNLLGRRIEDFLSDHLTLVPYVVAMLGCLFGDEDLDIPSLAGVFGGQPKGMTAAEFTTRLKELGPLIRDGKKANLTLRRLLTKELAKLRDHRELVKALAAQTLEREVNSTRVVLTPAGKQLEGYIRSERQSFDSSLRRLAAMQDPRRPRPPGRSPQPGPDPGDGGSPAEPDEDKKTTRPILERKSSPEAGFDKRTTPADSGGEPLNEPGDPEEPAGNNLPESDQVRVAGAESRAPRQLQTGASKTPPQPPSIGIRDQPGSYHEPVPEAGAGPSSDAGAKEPDFERFGPYAGILRNVQRNLHAAAGDPGPTAAAPVERERPLARATEQFRLRQIELASQYDAHFGINGERPPPTGETPVSDGPAVSDRPEQGDSS